MPIASGNQSDVLEWVDYSCNSCTSLTPGTQPELHASGNTPLAGALRAAREYYQGLDPRFGTSPIATDSFSGCRPYYVILLTDGDETCGGNPATAATELRNTNVGGTLYDIRTFVIGFGITPGDADTEAIATAGGTDAPGSNRAFYASDETSLALAFSQIMADSILYETCNGVDDDCDMAIDEGYTLYCDRPGGTPPPPTLCTDPGETVCDGIDDNCNGSVDEGLLNACGTCGAAGTLRCDTCRGSAKVAVTRCLVVETGTKTDHELEHGARLSAELVAEILGSGSATPLAPRRLLEVERLDAIPAGALPAPVDAMVRGGLARGDEPDRRTRGRRVEVTAGWVVELKLSDRVLHVWGSPPRVAGDDAPIDRGQRVVVWAGIAVASIAAAVLLLLVLRDL